MPRCVESRTARAAPVSAQKPLRGLRRVSRAAHRAHDAPAAAQACPRPMAEYEASSTQHGTSNALMNLPVNSTPVMMPAVFCASLEPCDRLKAAAESNCSLRKYLSMRDGLELRNSQYTSDHQQVRRHHADQRRADDHLQGERPFAGRSEVEASKLWLNPRSQRDARHGRARIPADQRVRRTGGQAQPPGDQVPDDRARSAPP